MILCSTMIHCSFEDVCNYILDEFKVRKGHTEQLYLCHELLLHKSCKEI